MSEIFIGIVAVVTFLSIIELVRESKEASKPYTTPIYPVNFVKAFHETRQQELKEASANKNNY